ncbi:Protein virilizer [Manis javanica]|nr:collagen alpha-1(I) chain-like isoform X2 [Manis javanica]KAI5931370.1 Protein virilizer [Manis javanica]
MRIVGGPAPPLGAQGRSGLRAQWGPLDRSRRGRGHPGPAGDAPAGGGNGSGGPGAGRDAEVGAAAAPAGHPGAAGLPRPAGPGLPPALLFLEGISYGRPMNGKGKWFKNLGAKNGTEARERGRHSGPHCSLPWSEDLCHHPQIWPP